MPRPTHTPPRQGLTLVEVLMALAILGISAAVLMTATSRCLAVVRVANNYYDARRVLELGEIEHPVLVYKDTTLGKAEEKILNPNVGPIDYPGGFLFSRTCSRSERNKDLVEVTTRVTWSLRGRESFEEVASYLYFTNDISM